MTWDTPSLKLVDFSLSRGVWFLLSARRGRNAHTQQETRDDMKTIREHLGVMTLALTGTLAALTLGMVVGAPGMPGHTKPHQMRRVNPTQFAPAPMHTMPAVAPGAGLHIGGTNLNGNR